MIKNIVFDYGAVLLDWNPHHLYDRYFGSSEKADWFLENVCTYEWNVQHDAGKPVAEGTDELVALHPEWEKEIRMYYGCFMEMIGGQIPGMEELVREYKGRGYHVYGLTNWSAETFALVRDVYPVFGLMEGMVVSGEEHVMKPDRRIYDLLVSRYGLKPEECVFIDDNENNVRGAREAGWQAIRFQDASQLRSALDALLKL